MSKSPAHVPLQVLIGHWKIFFPLIAQAWDGHDHISASILKNLLIPNTMENQFPHKKINTSPGIVKTLIKCNQRAVSIAINHAATHGARWKPAVQLMSTRLAGLSKIVNKVWAILSFFKTSDYQNQNHDQKIMKSWSNSAVSKSESWSKSKSKFCPQKNEITKVELRPSALCDANQDCAWAPCPGDHVGHSSNGLAKDSNQLWNK